MRHSALIVIGWLLMAVQPSTMSASALAYEPPKVPKIEGIRGGSIFTCLEKAKTRADVNECHWARAGNDKSS